MGKRIYSPSIMKKNGRIKESADSGGEIKLYRPILGNTLIFLDTGYFRDYCTPANQQNNEVLKYATDNKLVLCTSRVCIEEWRTQLLDGLNSYMNPVVRENDDMRQKNILAKKLLGKVYEEIRDKKKREDESRKIVEQFIGDYKIKIFEYKEHHIIPAWEAYFLGAKPPFQKLKCREDIPDAWICEGAKDVLSNAEYREIPNKLFFTTETKNGGIKDALLSLGLLHLTTADLVRIVKEEEQGLITPQPDTTPENTNITTGGAMSPLDKLLSKALDGHPPIWLRLLGFVEALDTPTHDELISRVATNLNANLELVSTSAKYLASAQYLKDTGSHYIIGNKAICKEAADRLTDEIIKMLGLGS